MRSEYFVYVIGEYSWRIISFSRHFSYEAAERAGHKRKPKYRGSSATDYEVTILTREKLEQMAQEGNYLINWKYQVLVHQGDTT